LTDLLRTEASETVRLYMFFRALYVDSGTTVLQRITTIQAGARPDGCCDMRPSRIHVITDYRLSETRKIFAG